MRKPVFEGAATALVTPFRHGSVDYPALYTLLDQQLESKISAVVVCGTTGESATLSDSEKIELITRTVEYIHGRCKIIAGTGTNDTAHTISLSRVISHLGVDAILAVTPYYNKCTQDGIALHYSLLADSVQCPVIVYNVPSRTGMNIAPHTYSLLSRHPNINGVKEANGDISAFCETMQEIKEDFFVWSGCDDLVIPMMAMGAVGVISVVSNVMPHAVVALADDCLAGSISDARVRYSRLFPLVKALFCEVNPIPVKYAMECMGYIKSEVRMPLTPLSPEHMKLTQSVMEGIKPTNPDA